MRSEKREHDGERREVWGVDRQERVGRRERGERWGERGETGEGEQRRERRERGRGEEMRGQTKQVTSLQHAFSVLPAEIIDHPLATSPVQDMFSLRFPPKLSKGCAFFSRHNNLHFFLIQVDSCIEAFGSNKQKRALNSRRMNQVGNETLNMAVTRAAENIIGAKGVASK